MLPPRQAWLLSLIQTEVLFQVPRFCILLDGLILLGKGPRDLQCDAAIDPQVASEKVKGKSDVAGKATVFIFPDLNTGNNTYKAVQQSTGALAIGPLIQGLAKPVNDLSRGCTVADIVNTIACTSIQSMGKDVV